MDNEETDRLSKDVHRGGGMSASLPPLPDINAETYPFEVVQHLLDEAAYFNMFSVPDQRRSRIGIATTGNPDGIIGLRISEVLHRFDVTVRAPGGGMRAVTADDLEDQKSGHSMGLVSRSRSHRAVLSATNAIGEPIGKFSHRWMIIPNDFNALPGREPPPTLLNPGRSQRFVMLDGICSFGGGTDGFHGFGTGITYPMVVNGQSQLHAAAVGNILEGFGKLKGKEGTYTYCGCISVHQGFSGNLMCRVMDPGGGLRTEAILPALERLPNPEQAVTYIVFRGQKKDKNQQTTYSFGSDGQVTGLNVVQQLRLFHLDATTRGRGGLRSTAAMGQVIGEMTAKIAFNLFDPGAPGTALSPIPFKSYNEYRFFDQYGESLGGFAADGAEGRTFNMKLTGAPGQATLRFGGVGPILNGTGRFSGIQGLMTDNSVVGIAPHALATLYVLRINDPDGKYREAINVKNHS